MKEDKFKGQHFPMYFQYTQEKDGSFIVDIRHTEPVLGITVHTSDIRLGNFKVTEVLEFIVEDSTKCFTAMPDYILVFTKKGENLVPVVHPFGINEYAGETPILPNILQAWNNANNSNLDADQLWEHLNRVNEDEKITKLNHYIWQRYASAVWDDIRIDNVLPFRDGKEEDDEKHVHALQLDVIDRLVELYSNPGEVVLTPFMGVGSEVYGPVSMGRKAIGIELKDSYYKQALRNLAVVKMRYKDKVTQTAIF